MENLDYIFDNTHSITFTKKLTSIENPNLTYKDSFTIEKKNLYKYSILKRFVKNI